MYQWETLRTFTFNVFKKMGCPERKQHSRQMCLLLLTSGV